MISMHDLCICSLLGCKDNLPPPLTKHRLLLFHFNEGLEDRTIPS